MEPNRTLRITLEYREPDLDCEQLASLVEAAVASLEEAGQLQVREIVDYESSPRPPA